jgi:hypothetical protein
VVISFEDLKASPHCLLRADAIYLVDQDERDVGQILWQPRQAPARTVTGKQFALCVKIERDNVEHHYEVQDLVREYKGPLTDDTELSIPVFSD